MNGGTFVESQGKDDIVATEASAIQDGYPEAFNQCYGCGSFNEHGLQLKSYWADDHVVAHFAPRPYHMAAPGFVYGGLIASLIDCHGTATAAAFGNRAAGRGIGSSPSLRYVTASLKVAYLRPTPLGPPIMLQGRAREVLKRRIVADIDLTVEGIITARGEVIAVEIPRSMLDGGW